MRPSRPQGGGAGAPPGGARLDSGYHPEQTLSPRAGSGRRLDRPPGGARPGAIGGSRPKDCTTFGPSSDGLGDQWCAVRPFHCNDSGKRRRRPAMAPWRARQLPPALRRCRTIGTLRACCTGRRRPIPAAGLCATPRSPAPCVLHRHGPTNACSQCEGVGLHHLWVRGLPTCRPSLTRHAPNGSPKSTLSRAAPALWACIRRSAGVARRMPPGFRPGRPLSLRPMGQCACALVPVRSPHRVETGRPGVARGLGAVAAAVWPKARGARVSRRCLPAAPVQIRPHDGG